MAIVTTDNQYYGDIADAIRAKNGATGTYTPAQMAAAIGAISGGGGSGNVTLENLECVFGTDGLEA